MHTRSPGKRRHVLIIGGILVALCAFLAYWGAHRTSGADADKAGVAFDPTSIGKNEELTIGLKAAPALAARYGGLSNDAAQKALVVRVGQKLAATTIATKAGYRFTFDLLAEPNILNAFVLPGGQVYVTTALLNRVRTEGELAAVLAHQVAHGLARDALVQLAASMPAETTSEASREGALVSQMQTMRYTTTQETDADALALTLMSQAGYSPSAMLGLLQVLSTAYYAGAQVEYFTTHPNPPTRVADIQAAIKALYPQGVPVVLSK